MNRKQRILIGLSFILITLFTVWHFSAPPVNASYATSVIKSIQYGTVSLGTGVTSAAATITSVNTAKAALIYLGGTSNAASGVNTALTRITLTNATTVTGTRDDGTTSSTIVSFVVVEFY